MNEITNDQANGPTCPQLSPSTPMHVARTAAKVRLQRCARATAVMALSGILALSPSATAAAPPSAASPHHLACPMQATMRTESGCEARFSWPLRDASHDTVSSAFDPPPRPWLPGHRGVDLTAAPGRELLAPAAGTVAFSGSVGGKDVVTIRHRDGRTTTYEPAVATVPVGTALDRGDVFAHVEGGSDHCGDGCLHWGLREDDGYADPAALTRPRRIALKE